MSGFQRLHWSIHAEVPRVVVYPNEDEPDGMICDSPIEGAFAELVFKTLRIKDCGIVPQYPLGPYRYDFAILFKCKPVVLIECDGAAYHCTPEQRANDARKNELALRHGLKLLRFRGTDIYRRPSLCIDDLLLTLEEMGFME